MYKTLYLKKGKDASVRRYHPWIFSGAIERQESDIAEGETVRILDSEGTFLAVGHFQIGSIAVRILSFDDVVLDKIFLSERLRQAIQVRYDLNLFRADNSICRIVHGEGDGLPGLVIDIYDKTAVIQAHSVGMHLWRKLIAEVLLELLPERLGSIYYKSDQTLPFKADLDSESGYLYGQDDVNVAVENGLKFQIDWLKGQKTGFFVDQRENRCWLEQFSRGKKVLNMFCYTGGFSVYAMRGGATLVHSVDSSARAIETTDTNVALNFEDTSRHQSFASDAFKFLSEMAN